MNRLLIIFSLFLISCVQSPVESIAQGSSNQNSYYNRLSANFLKALKNGENVESYIEKLATINADSLNKSLHSPKQKKAFWINIYNANIQYILTKNPSLYESRSAFFSKEQIQIANQSLSFDDIEHGILRGSTWKLSLGYIKNPFAPEFETKFRLGSTDPRIHFALNCGAMSCPPIAIYSAENFEEEIDKVAALFLNRVSNFNTEKNEVTTTALFTWFRGDFGGTSGARKMLVQYGVLPKESDADIEYADYDWTMKLGIYYED